MSTYADVHMNDDGIAEDYWGNVTHVMPVYVWPTIHTYEGGEWRGTEASAQAGGLRHMTEAFYRLAGAITQARRGAYQIVENATNAPEGVYEGAAQGIDAWWKHEGMALDLQASTLLEVAERIVLDMARSASAWAERIEPLEES